MAASDQILERINQSLSDLGEEMRAMRSDLGDEMRAMRSGFTTELRVIHRCLTQIGVGLAGVVAVGLIMLFATEL